MAEKRNIILFGCLIVLTLSYWLSASFLIGDKPFEIRVLEEEQQELRLFAGGAFRSGGQGSGLPFVARWAAVILHVLHTNHVWLGSCRAQREHELSHMAIRTLAMPIKKKS